MAGRSMSGKRVLLTGASSGIGWYLASELVRAGAFVVISGRRSERLQQLRLAFGNPQKRLIALAGDISDPQHRRHLVATTVAQLGGIDIVVNNAGVGAIGSFEDASPERLRRVFEVDFFGATELTRLALPHLKRGVQPAICIVNSVLGHRAVPNKSEYCAAKFALRGWSESLRVELKPAGVDVVSISPSTTRSEFFDSLLEEKAVEVSHAPLYVDDSPSRSVSEIAAVARRIKQREKRLGLIVIDYLQLIEPDNSRDPRQEQVAKIARRLKGLAREQSVPVLCLSQLNRQAEEGKDHRPRMSHLRESGAIEQDADVVMFVHREEYYHRGDDASQYAGQAEIIIAKQRNGPVGEIELTWEKEFTRFYDRAPERHSEFDNYGGGGFQTPGGM